MAKRLTFREVTPDRWRDFEALFESPGGPKYCWCMAWRAMPRGASRDDRAAKKTAMEQRVRDGTPVGILAYEDGEPVAWCSVAPRPTYRELGGPEAPDPDHVWSIVCFYVPSRYRRQGMMQRLIRAAVAHAKRKGAKTVEAYPVDPDSPSYRFMGFVRSFEEAGFREVGRAGSRRHVMRLEV